MKCAYLETCGHTKSACASDSSFPSVSWTSTTMHSDKEQPTSTYFWHDSLSYYHYLPSKRQKGQNYVSNGIFYLSSLSLARMTLSASPCSPEQIEASFHAGNAWKKWLHWFDLVSEISEKWGLCCSSTTVLSYHVSRILSIQILHQNARFCAGAFHVSTVRNECISS